jgi:hypothetical protein
MRSIKYIMLSLVFTGALSASLPRLAVVSIDFDEFAPDSVLLREVMDEMLESGRFEIVELDADAFMDMSPDFLMDSFRTLAADHDIDIFLALEILYPETNDRTVFRNDSLKTFRAVSVDVLGRFYSSTGTLIGTIRNTTRREEVLPYSPDEYMLALLSAEELASRAILELFPMEVTFTASNSEVFTVPAGTNQGVDNGTIMAVVAISSGIPDNVFEYEQLRSRGLLQIMDAGTGQSTARLLSGHLVEGGTVSAIEQSSPALMYLEYGGALLTSEAGAGLEESTSEWSNSIRFGIETAKWGGLSFGGGILAGGLEHSSLIGISLQAGTRIPLRSPSLGLRLSAGGEMAFHMQDVRSIYLASSATAISVSAIADATMEYLFSGHLGLQIGVSGAIGTTADSWTVQENTGNIRKAEPDELYYTELKQGPLGVHAGLMYFMF